MQEIFKVRDGLALCAGKDLYEVIGMNKEWKANICLQLYGPDGKLKDERLIHNQVQTVCKSDLANLLGTSPTVAKAGWMEVGTGSGQAVSNVTLAAYITTLPNRCPCSTLGASANGSSSGAVITYSCTFGATYGTGAITEIGLFNVVTANTGDMWLYSSFAVINKGASDTLAVTWTLTFS